MTTVSYNEMQMAIRNIVQDSFDSVYDVNHSYGRSYSSPKSDRFCELVAGGTMKYLYGLSNKDKEETEV